MKAIYKLPGREPEIIEVENELYALQEKVGGYIEMVLISTDVCIICNEEGLLRGLPYNVYVAGVAFVGPILVVGVDEDVFCDVPSPAFWLDQIKGGKRS